MNTIPFLLLTLCIAAPVRNPSEKLDIPSMPVPAYSTYYTEYEWPNIKLKIIVTHDNIGLESVIHHENLGHIVAYGERANEYQSLYRNEWQFRVTWWRLSLKGTYYLDTGYLYITRDWENNLLMTTLIPTDENGSFTTVTTVLKTK